MILTYWQWIVEAVTAAGLSFGWPGTGLGVVLAFLIFLGTFLSLFSIFTVWSFSRKRPPALETSKPLPKVSVLKACYANEDGEELNFVEWFEQDYPGEYELLFVVSQESDPIVPIVRQFQARYPKIQSRLVISTTRRSFWKKIDALYDGHRAATGDIMIWSDSDTIVKRDYIRGMVATFQDPTVSVVSTPQYDTGADTLGTAMKNMGNNADVGQFLMTGDWWMDLWNRRNKWSFGQSIGFRRAEFDAFGPEAWETIFNFLADDMALPYVFWKHGKRIRLMNIYCPVRYSGKSFVAVMKQKLRWVNCQKLGVGNTLVYASGMFFYPFVPALFLGLLVGFTPAVGGLMVTGMVARMMASVWFEWKILGSLRQTWRWFWAVPLWDVIQLFFFAYGALNTKLIFDGVQYEVYDRYFMRKIEHDEEKAALIAQKRHK